MRDLALGVCAFIFAATLNVGALAQERQPVTLEGKCAQEAGAPYDSVRGGWYTQGREQARAYRACLYRKLTGTYIVA